MSIQNLEASTYFSKVMSVDYDDCSCSWKLWTWPFLYVIGDPFADNADDGSVGSQNIRKSCIINRPDQVYEGGRWKISKRSSCTVFLHDMRQDDDPMFSSCLIPRSTIALFLSSERFRDEWLVISFWNGTAYWDNMLTCCNGNVIVTLIVSRRCWYGCSGPLYIFSSVPS